MRAIGDRVATLFDPCYTMRPDGMTVADVPGTGWSRRIGALRRGLYDVFDPPILQFGPPRTGSTLVWNTLREIFPFRRVVKTHTLSPFRLSVFSRSEIVCTVRHPLDTVASSLQRYDLLPSAETIQGQLAELDDGMQWALRVKDHPRALILKYERFAGDFEGLFDSLERFFGVVVDPGVRARVRNTYAIDEVKKRADSLGDFSHFDPDTHIHGRHVSRHAGRSGTYREFFDRDQIDRLRRHYASFLEAFDYVGDDSPRAGGAQTPFDTPLDRD